MRKRISLSLMLAVLVSTVAAQQKERDKPESGSRRADTALRQAEEAQRKTQAIDILKGVVESSAEIKDTLTQLSVLTGALNLLWKHDEKYTRAQFIKSAAALSDRFASDAIDSGERADTRLAMRALLNAYARHDPKAAEQQLDKFQKLLEEVLKESSDSAGERLMLAEASLESNTGQSAALAAKVLEADVPVSFIAYLNELEQRDPAAAASLFRTALSILAGGRVYDIRQVNLLSNYVFRERQTSVPMFNSSHGPSLDFGFVARPLSPLSKDLNSPLVGAYLAAARSYLNANAVGLEQLSQPNAIQVAYCFFVVKELRGYADKLGLDRGQNWAVLDTRFTHLAERAKLNARALNGLAELAQRMVIENTVYRFDSGDAAFAAAEKAVDPNERLELMATGIRQLIDDGKYAEALPKIAELRDEKFQEQLNTYRSFHMAQTAFRNLDWDGFNAQVNRVSDAPVRTYLLLSAARAASDAGTKDVCSEFLVAAMALLTKIEDARGRAAVLVTTAGILYAMSDTSWGAQVLNEGVKAINRAEKYDGHVYGVTLEAPKHGVWLPFPKSDLSHLFEQAAKRDWNGAIAAAQSIESKTLRSRAYIAACRTVL